MSQGTFLGLAAGIQILIVAADLIERRVTGQGRYGGHPLRPAGFGFLLVVGAVFLLFQLGGLLLAPGPTALFDGVRRLRGVVGTHAAGTAAWQAVAVVSVLTFYLAGLCDYVIHRFVSHGRWLWFTHEYHHLPNQVFAAVPGVSARPFTAVATVPVMTITVFAAHWLGTLVGLPAEDATPLWIVLLSQVVVLTTSHSCFLRRFWWAHRVLQCLAVTSPQEHILHHTVDLRGNYGNFTTLWDRVFGTHLDPALSQHQGHRLGLGYDQDFLGTLTLGRYKLAEPLRRRFQVARYCNIGTPPHP